MKEKRLVLIGTVLVLAALLGAFYLFLQERRRQLAFREPVSTEPGIESTVLEDQSTGSLNVTLFFYDAGKLSFEDDFLKPEERTLLRIEDPLLMARQIMFELFKGSSEEIAAVESGISREEENYPVPTFPKGSRLRELYLLNDGTAVIDLSQDTVSGIGGGITAELAVIRSITRSLVDNVEGIAAVRFLVEGKERETLAGHISLDLPFR